MWSKDDLLLLPITFVIMLCIAIGLYFLLRNKSDKVKLIPFWGVGSIIVILEIVKQLHQVVQGLPYEMWSIPLHICSILVFSMPLAVFLKPNAKITNIIGALTLIVCILSTGGLYVYPQMIISGSASNIFRPNAPFLDYHTFIFHNLAVLFIMLNIAFKVYKPNFKQICIAIGAYGVFMIFSAIMANILNVNYAMFLSFGVGPFNQIRNAAGMFIYDLVVWIVYVIAALIAGLMLYYIPKLYNIIIKNPTKMS